jgi:hypothetical protein
MGDALMVRGALAVEISGCEVGCDLELGVKLLRAFMAQLEQCWVVSVPSVAQGIPS